MRGIPVRGIWLFGLLLAPATLAQDVTEALALAQQKVEAKEWTAALQILLGVDGSAATEAEQQELGARFGEVGSGLRSAGQFAAALRSHEAALAIRQRLHGDRDHAEIAESLNNVAVARKRIGKLAEALPMYEASLAMRKRLFDDGDHDRIAVSLANLASCLEAMDRAEEALPHREAGLAMWQRLHDGGDHANVASGLNNLAVCLRAVGRVPEALARHEAALAMRQRLHGDSDHADVAASLNNVGHCLNSLGRSAEALPQFEAAVSMRRRLHGQRDHPETAHCLKGLAVTLNALGRFDAALQHNEAALAMRKRLHGDRDATEVADSLAGVACSLEGLGRFDDALGRHEEALAMNRRLHGEGGDITIVSSMEAVANCLRAIGRYEDACSTQELAWRELVRLGRSDEEKAGFCLTGLAFLLQVMDRNVEALQKLEMALAIWRRLHGDADHENVAFGLQNTALAMSECGQTWEAVRQFDAATKMYERLLGDRDDAHLARCLGNFAELLRTTGREEEALRHSERALAMRRRLHGERDHADVARSLRTMSLCLRSSGRFDEALAQSEASLAMERRLHEDHDDSQVAVSLHHVALCWVELGHPDDALPLHEEALAMWRRLAAGRDYQEVATSLNNLALCLLELGRHGEALGRIEESLAIRRRLYGDGDHPRVAFGLNTLGLVLEGLGRSGEALHRHEASLAMRRRLYRGLDHPEVATSLNNLGHCLLALGRSREALEQCQESLAMRQRQHGGRDHARVATCLLNTAHCLTESGRHGEALAMSEAAFFMLKRLYGDRDHSDLARALNFVASCQRASGRLGEALSTSEAALAMLRRLNDNRDHPVVAVTLGNSAVYLQALGRFTEAIPRYEAALAMRQRLYGETDSPELVRCLSNMSSCLHAMNRPAEALPHCHLAVAMAERIRDDTLTSAVFRQSLFDEMKSGSVFERLQVLAVQLSQPADALHAAERGRGRELLDLLEQQRFDGFDEALQRAQRRGDDATVQRLSALQQEVRVTETEGDRLLHQLTVLDLAVDDRSARRPEILVKSNENNTRRRRLLDERARLLGDVLPVGRVRLPSEIQATLRSDELFLEFTLSENASFLYVLAHQGDVEAIALPKARATVQRLLGGVLSRSSKAQIADARGRDPEGGAAPVDAAAAQDSSELFGRLIPQSLWPRIRGARRVFLAAHRELHRLPFELLVTGSKDGAPVHWLDEGPAISYVPSGSALHWLRQRARDVRGDPTGIDLLAVGDPGELAVEPEVPELGVFVLSVIEGGEGARIGLLPRDVLRSYDGRELVDDKTLRDACATTVAAIEDGKRADTPIPMQVWRRGELLELQLRKGDLSIQVGLGRARAAFEASLGNAAQIAHITRSGEIERLRRLPPLRGARLETAAIAAVFAGKQKTATSLLGADATEPAVFDLAAKAKHLHFACHGLAEEYAGQSLSMLLLSQPHHVLPNDNGLLKLDDLLSTWRDRLSSCRLVVLSACRTNVGPTFRDEAPQALPIGFLFAGAPAVISSLWAVDDESTRILMTDFYGRLLAGETDKLAAFTAAKKALRSNPKFADPFHWAPFLYIGSPE